MSLPRIRTRTPGRIRREHDLAFRLGLWRPPIITPKDKPKPPKEKPDGKE
jgi:hypothetical protein